MEIEDRPIQFFLSTFAEKMIKKLGNQHRRGTDCKTMPKLVINPGTPQTYEFQLKPGTTSVGRGVANDFKIEDPSVSTNHAHIVVDGTSVMVRDLGSTNGTYINRAQVTEQALQPGQFLRLGGVEMLFEGDAATPTAGVVEAPVTVAAVAAAPAAGLRLAGSTHGAPVAPVLATSGGGLRISHAAPAAVAATTAPPPIAPPPIAPPIPSAAAGRPGAKPVCKFHPKSPSRWLCPQCGHQYCDLCVGTRPTAEGTGHFCRPCGAQCSPVSVDVNFGRSKRGNFFTELPGAFVYPFKRGGAFLLVCATVFFVVVEFLKGYSFYLQIVFMGYLFAYMQNVIHTTAHGDEHEPSLPEVGNFMDDIIVPCLQLVGTVVLCFGPAIGMAIWAGVKAGEELAAPDPMMALGVMAAVAVGCLYFPMAFLGVAMFDTVTAINPMLVVPAICKVPLQYLVACVLFAVVIMVRMAGGIIANLIPIPVVPTVISSFLGLYFLTVQCRVLGLLYFSNKQKLGWFKR
ncbi:MAG: domain containing protein [Pedosphaera sp.]|nr:domain containing protein [Pedosphaera sp.]